jgi:hypothetical protein
MAHYALTINAPSYFVDLGYLQAIHAQVLHRCYGNVPIEVYMHHPPTARVMDGPIITPLRSRSWSQMKP